MNVSRAAIGLAVRAARETAGLTLADLAQKTEISISSLSRLETGQRGLDLSEAGNICRCVGIDVLALYMLSENYEIEGVAQKAVVVAALRKDINDLQRKLLLATVQANA